MRPVTGHAGTTGGGPGGTMTRKCGGDGMVTTTRGSGGTETT